MIKSIQARWRCALVIWLAAWPAMTALLFLLEPTVGTWPLPLRTLIVSVLMVPAMVLWLVPALTARLAGFLDTAPADRCRPRTSRTQRP